MNLIGQIIYHKDFHAGEIIDQNEKCIYAMFKSQKKLRIGLYFPNKDYLKYFHFVDDEVNKKVNKEIFSDEEYQAYLNWFNFPENNFNDLDGIKIDTGKGILLYLAKYIVTHKFPTITKSQLKKVLYDEGFSKELVTKLMGGINFYQNLCDTIFSHSKYIYEYMGKQRIGRFRLEEKVKYHKIPSAPLQIKTRSNNLNFTDFILYVYKSLVSINCINKEEHDTESITIETKNLHDDKIIFNAFYCSKCGKYFTNIESIEHEFKKNYYPIIRLKFENDTEIGLKEFSELSLYGYNVRESGKNDEEREQLLSTLVYNNIIKKDRIIAILQWLIKFNGKNPNCNEAIKKWEKDLLYIQNYNLEKQRKINATIDTNNIK